MTSRADILRQVTGARRIIVSQRGVPGPHDIITKDRRINRRMSFFLLVILSGRGSKKK